MLLCEPLLDLVHFGRTHRAPCGKAFAIDIALMTDMVLHRYMSEPEVLGIRACIRQRLRTLKWRSCVWHFPVGAHRFADGTFELEERTEILPNSLIATVLLHRTSLDEGGTGLAPIIFSELANGLEWACYVSQFETKVEESANAKLIPVEMVREYISWACIQTKKLSDA